VILAQQLDLSCLRDGISGHAMLNTLQAGMPRMPPPMGGAFGVWVRREGALRIGWVSTGMTLDDQFRSLLTNN
jgi:hypothetical protein